MLSLYCVLGILLMNLFIEPVPRLGALALVWLSRVSYA